MFSQLDRSDPMQGLGDIFSGSRILTDYSASKSREPVTKVMDPTSESGSTTMLE
jgi:hypothetical protein